MECAAAQATFLESMFQVYQSRSESRAIWSEWLRSRHGGRISWELRFDKSMTENEKLVFFEDLRKLKTSMPIAYVLGEIIWADIKWKVDERALIPRPETEELLQAVLREVNPSDRIVDACTGSGCIAIATKLKVPSTHLIAFDLSSDALGLAEENADSKNVQIDWYKSNLLEPIPDWVSSGGDDIWVSNPPYIPVSEILDKSLGFEPDMALYVSDDNPIIYYQKIIKWSLKGLKKGGFLFLEVHYDFCFKIKMHLENQNKWSEIKIIDDDCGKHRFIKAVRE
tara:strand:+ start:1046 stop:1891 length:846 start_codon:yes stop_codon:yes gene_type:complete